MGGGGGGGGEGGARSALRTFLDSKGVKIGFAGLMT